MRPVQQVFLRRLPVAPKLTIAVVRRAHIIEMPMNGSVLLVDPARVVAAFDQENPGNHMAERVNDFDTATLGIQA